MRLSSYEIRPALPLPHSLRFYWPGLAFRHAAQPLLREELGDEPARALWAGQQREWRRLRRDLPRQSLGVHFLLRYMALDLALYRAALERDIAPERAGEWVREINWRIFGPMTGLAFRLSRLRSGQRMTRVRFVVDLMFAVIFSAPFQRVKQPEAEEVSFHVTACPLADYFRGQGAAELTRYAACSLDHAMARQWGVGFSRRQTIAGGAEFCDFRFWPKDGSPPG